MGHAAVKLAESVGYENAGTMEFLVDDEGHFYFMEMNTRIQVEHTITEEVYGCDLVKEQIRIAAGEKLSPHVAHAAAALARDPMPDQCRGSGEQFPAVARANRFYYAPGGRGVRVDSHAYTGYTVPPYYDSLIAKLITVGATRESAIARMRRALDEYYITGIKTTVPFHAAIMRNGDFRDGKYDTGFVERLMNSDNFELIPTPATLARISVATRSRDCRSTAILDLGYVDAVDCAGRVAEAMIAGRRRSSFSCAARSISVGELVDLAEAAASTSLRRRAIPLIINDHAEIAREFRWKACTLGRMTIAIATARESVGREIVVGKSTHSLEQAVAARARRRGLHWLRAAFRHSDQTRLSRRSVSTTFAKFTSECHSHFLHRRNQTGKSGQVIAAGAKRVVIVSGLLQANDIAEYARACKELAAICNLNCDRLISETYVAFSLLVPLRSIPSKHRSKSMPICSAVPLPTPLWAPVFFPR